MTDVLDKLPATLKRGPPDIVQARNAVTAIKTVEEAKDASDKLGAIIQYMENAGYPPEQCNEAAQLKLEAERAGGQLLAKIDREKVGPGRGKQKGVQRRTGFRAA